MQSHGICRRARRKAAEATHRAPWSSRRYPHSPTASLNEILEPGEELTVKPQQVSKLHGLIQSPRRSPSNFIFIILNLSVGYDIVWPPATATHHFGLIRAGVPRGAVNLLQNPSPSCPPSSSSKLAHIFPAAGSEMATLLSAPKTFIVLQGPYTIPQETTLNT